MSKLSIIVPTRGRPTSVPNIINAWRDTGAFEDGGELVFVVDLDDPKAGEYQAFISSLGGGLPVAMVTEHDWRPLVPKLNRMACVMAEMSPSTPLGFMGDDHLPRTPGWVKEILSVESPSVISSPDGLRADDLPTWWVMSPSIVSALGCMVPGGMEHLYCDNAVRDLAVSAGVYRYLPDVLIEHMHPLAGKAESDAGYEKVNSASRYREDGAAYLLWQYREMARDVEKVKALRG